MILITPNNLRCFEVRFTVTSDSVVPNSMATRVMSRLSYFYFYYMGNMMLITTVSTCLVTVTVATLLSSFVV